MTLEVCRRFSGPLWETHTSDHDIYIDTALRPKASHSPTESLVGNSTLKNQKVFRGAERKGMSRSWTAMSLKMPPPPLTYLKTHTISLRIFEYGVAKRFPTTTLREWNPPFQHPRTRSSSKRRAFQIAKARPTQLARSFFTKSLFVEDSLHCRGARKAAARDRASTCVEIQVSKMHIIIIIIEGLSRGRGGARKWPALEPFSRGGVARYSKRASRLARASAP